MRAESGASCQATASPADSSFNFRRGSIGAVAFESFPIFTAKLNCFVLIHFVLFHSLAARLPTSCDCRRRKVFVKSSASAPNARKVVKTRVMQKGTLDCRKIRPVAQGRT